MSVMVGMSWMSVDRHYGGLFRVAMESQLSFPEALGSRRTL